MQIRYLMGSPIRRNSVLEGFRQKVCSHPGGDRGNGGFEFRDSSGELVRSEGDEKLGVVCVEEVR